MQQELVHTLAAEECNLFQSAIMTPSGEGQQFQAYQEVRSEEVENMAKNLLLNSLTMLNLPELDFAQNTLNGVYGELADEIYEEQQLLQ